MTLSSKSLNTGDPNLLKIPVGVQFLPGPVNAPPPPPDSRRSPTIALPWTNTPSAFVAITSPSTTSALLRVGAFGFGSSLHGDDEAKQPRLADAPAPTRMFP